MTTQGKLQIPAVPDPDIASVPSVPRWLGLVTSQHRLFSACQDGWLHPLVDSSVIGHNCFASEKNAADRSIPVCLMIDVRRLPFQDAWKCMAQVTAEDGDGDAPRLVNWCAPIPVYAIVRMEVQSAEHRVFLNALQEQFANVCLPDIEITLSDFASPASAREFEIPAGLNSLKLPETLNATHGAMTMAVWAVPRVNPWIEVLHRSLGGNTSGASHGIAALGASWLQLPWQACEPKELSTASRDEATCRIRCDGGDEMQALLWQAALRCLRWPLSEGKSAVALAKEIAQVVLRDGACGAPDAWLEKTQRIIGGEEKITCDGWRRDGAGLAIRLVLLRPNVEFISWGKHLDDLPLAVWWAAAVLWGWQCGYRALEKGLRGGALLQEFLSTRALASAWTDELSTLLPASQQAPLERTDEDNCFILSWRGHAITRKKWRERAKWYEVDLSDAKVGRFARDMAVRLGWPCVERRLVLPEGRLSVVGGGRLTVEGDALRVEGCKYLRLPDGVDLEKQVDPDGFRLHLATEPGVVNNPPSPAADEIFGTEAHVAEHSESDIPSALSHYQKACSVSGLIYKPDFLSEEHAEKVLVQINGGEWSTELQRRVQHFGWRYDYKQRRIDESTRLGDLPGWALELAAILVDEGLMLVPPDQVIVNEYVGKQGITPHIDLEDGFTERVATISLLETWGMVFRRRGSKDKVEIPLEHRSVAVLTGDARYKWTHEIPQRANELVMDPQGKRRRVKRGRRISVTFRTTRRRGQT